ncbi:MAG TPA: hypothetical protein VH184_10905 [Dongiaceae bacterium]|nr:hypothetical protein [Dongiaceae bacterium]
MRGLVLVAALLMAVPLGASAQTGSSTPSSTEQPFMADGEVLLKKLTARQFDRRLPATNLKDWLSSLLSKRARIDWSTTDCGDEGGGPDSGAGQSSAGASDSGQSDESTDTSGSGLDSPLCTEAQALFYGRDGKPSLDRYVVVQLLVGTSRNGVNPNAASYGPDAVSVFVFDGAAMHTLSRLGDLPPMLTAMK